ncbi:MAG TPA: hypothetical protein VKN18_32655 [Blastocatellia bacterium]|nr:hypothetical protein [Blastocatellia bacterium]
MNLIGLILIAALSGGIVAVSLRLRASASSEGMWTEGNRFSDEDRQSAGRRPDSQSNRRFRSRFALVVNRFL